MSRNIGKQFEIMQTIWTKYAELLVDYCLEIEEGQRLYIQSTTLAEPLIREVFRAAMQRGAAVETDLRFCEQERIFYEGAESEMQLAHASPLTETAMKKYEAFLNIRAPFNLREDQSVDPGKRKRRQKHLEHLNQAYFKRTARGDLTRTLCQFPTQANAQEAGMSLEEYSEFVFGACRLDADDPMSEWLKVRDRQQSYVDYLNECRTIRYVNPETDISCSIDGRTWINSAGRTNMPSGEVFTSPVEDSVNGSIHFDYPAVYKGHEVQGITLEVENGYIERWNARIGQRVLDEIFSIDGTRRFGEIAVGTNERIQQATKNVLFDEKIGGTVHMAVGQSYLQTGGENQSTVHWDMIADMSEGAIYADDEKIYENGRFLID